MALTKVKGHILADDLALGGNPTTSTQSASDNSTKIATTAYVTTALANLSDSAPSTLNTLNELAAALGDDANFSTTVTNSIAAKAPLASPTLTGTPKINVGTNKNIIFSGGIGEIGSVPGFQGINDAGSANTDIGMRGTTIRFATGSSERMRIDSAGKVRIGATLGLNHLLNLQTASTSGLAQMEFRNTAAGSQIGMPANTNALSIFTADAERMRVDSSGNVGVGETSPVHKVEAKGTDAALVVHNDNNSRGGIVALASQLVGFTSTSVNDDLVFGHAGNPIASSAFNEKMRIDNGTGNVGIGETTPLGKLHVKTADSGASVNSNADELVIEGSGTAGITILSGTTGDGNLFFDDSGGFARGKLSYSHNGDYLSLSSSGASIFYNGGSERMRILSGGNVGIGTNNPSAKCHLYTSTSDAINLGIQNSQRYWKIETVSEKVSIADVSAGGTARMTFDTAGNVGIGTTSPPSPLSIFGTGTSSPTAANAQQSYDNAIFRINSFANSSVGLSIGSTGSNVTHIQTSYNEGTTSPLTLNPFGGNVGIGTSSPQGLIDLTVSQAKTTTSGATFAQLGKTNESSGYAALQCEVKGGASAADRKWEFQTIEQGVANAGSIVFQPAGGKVGIGTVPTMPLSVQAASNAYAISMHGRSDGYSELYGASNDGSTKYSFLQSHSAQTKLYTLVNTPLLFGTNSTERMRIDSSGRVGIRNDGPGDFHAQADDLVIGDSSGHSGMTFRSSTTDAGNIFFADGTSGSQAYMGSIQYFHGADSSNNLSERMSFGCNGGSEVLRLSRTTNIAYTSDGLFNSNARPSRWQATGSGALLLGYRDSGSGLYSAALALEYDAVNGLGNTQYVDGILMRDTASGTLHLRIETNGNVKNTNNSYGSTSDSRLKTDIADAASQWDDVKALRVRKYKFGTAPAGHDFLQIGVIAQELEASGMSGLVSESEPDDAQIKYAPELVGNQVKTVKYSVLYMKAIKALQEAMTRIETLESKVATLEGE